MDMRRLRRDLDILERERASGRSDWTRHTWRQEGGAVEVFLFDFALPANAHPRRVHVRLEVPPNLYDRAPDGGRVFYRNVWVSAPVRVTVPGTRDTGPLPRLHAPDGRGWRFLCVHPDGLVRGEENVLTFLRVLQLFVLHADPRVW